MKAPFDDESWASLGFFQHLDIQEEVEALTTEDAEFASSSQCQLRLTGCAQDEPAVTSVFDALWFIRLSSKQGRNALCWCGNTQKYKNCHLQADRLAPSSEFKTQ